MIRSIASSAPRCRRCRPGGRARKRSIAGFSRRTIGLPSFAIRLASGTPPCSMRSSESSSTALRVAQLLDLARDDPGLERVGLRVDQAQRLDGPQVPRRLDARPRESAGSVLRDDRRPHGERAERHDRQRHARHGAAGEQLGACRGSRRRGHIRASRQPPALTRASSGHEGRLGSGRPQRREAVAGSARDQQERAVRLAQDAGRHAAEHHAADRSVARASRRSAGRPRGRAARARRRRSRRPPRRRSRPASRRRRSRGGSGRRARRAPSPRARRCPTRRAARGCSPAAR